MIITFDTDLSDYSVECLSDLPTSCDETVGANRGDVSCILGEQRLADNTCDATTAEGTGEDGAIVLFDVDGNPHDDRYFAPTAEGLTLTQFDNGVAQVSGQVADIDNPNAILNVQIVYDQGVSGTDWGGGLARHELHSQHEDRLEHLHPQLRLSYLKEKACGGTCSPSTTLRPEAFGLGG